MESSPQLFIEGHSKTSDAQLTMISSGNNLQQTQDGQGLIVSSHSFNPSTLCINGSPSVMTPSVTQGVTNVNSIGTISLVDNNFLGASQISNPTTNAITANDLVLRYTGAQSQPINVIQSNSVPQTQPQSIFISDIDGGRQGILIL